MSRMAFAAGAVAVLVAFGLVGRAGETDQTMRDWSHLVPIRLEKTPGKGVVEFPLTPRVFDMANRDLGDLRVVAETGEEAPYVLRVGEAKSRIVTLKVKTYNRTYISGRQSSVTVDFGTKVSKNRIDVSTAGTNFRRGVLVEGSDDGTSWQKV